MQTRKRPLRPAPCPTEYEEQCRVITWARTMSAIEPRLRLLRAGMEGVRLSIGTRVKAKRAGMNSAWPDLFLSVPQGDFDINPVHGLYIELKRRKGGTVSPEQREMHSALRKQGYLVHVCRGAGEAISTICAYLEIPPPMPTRGVLSAL